MPWQVLWQALQETLIMVLASTIIAAIFGLPLGLALACTSPGHILENRFINRVLGAIVNVGRSIPFIILMVAIIPFTRWLVGTSIGTTAAIVPLSIAAYLRCRSRERNFEIDPGVVKQPRAWVIAWQIIWKVLIPEAASSFGAYHHHG